MFDPAIISNGLALVSVSPLLTKKQTIWGVPPIVGRGKVATKYVFKFKISAAIFGLLRKKCKNSYIAYIFVCLNLL